MRLKVVLMVFVFLLTNAAFTENVDGQKISKKQMKALKKKKKKMSVNAFSELIESEKSLKGEVSGLKNEIADIKAAGSKDVEQVRELKEKLATARETIAELEARPPTPEPSSTAADTDSNETKANRSSRKRSIHSGVIYRVQIGAFKNKDLSKYFNKEGSFDGETSVDENKYTLGTFTDYWEADTFKKLLREMGVKEAWIVPYNDGKRVSLKDVLEGVYD